MLSQAVSPMLRTGKYQHLTPVPRANDKRKQLTFTHPVYRVNHLIDRFSRRIAAGHFNQLRRSQKAIRQLPNRPRKRRRKQQRLAIFRHQRQNLTDIVNKAHIQHAIRFV